METNNTNAPILIITLNRFNHLKNCIDSLSRCIEADRSELYIALDYPKEKWQWEGYDKILEYLDTIKGFSKVNLIKRSRNLGIKENYHDATQHIFKYHDCIIFSEDDNVFSKDFLIFMNDCLSKYRDNNEIFSISGYNYPIEIPNSYRSPVYKWKGHSAWGCGFWRDKYQLIDWNNKHALRIVQRSVRNFKILKNLHQTANIYSRDLNTLYSSKLIHGDIYITLLQFIKNQYSIFPTISRVTNHGRDGSGAHCEVQDLKQEYHNNNNIEHKKGSLPQFIYPDKKINKALRIHFKLPFFTNLVNILKLFLIGVNLFDLLRNSKAIFGAKQ